MGALGLTGPQTYADNVSPSQGLRLGKHGQVITSHVHGKYYEQASRGALQTAHAIITAPVIYTTAAGTGGPLLHNTTSTHLISVLAVGWGVSVVTTVAATLGLTGGSGQTAAMGSTTAIDSIKNCYIGGGASAIASSVYRVGTPTTAGSFFHPLGDLHTGALTVDTGSMHWVDIDGLFILPQYAWISFAASATASTTVGNFGMIWEEIAL